MNEKKKLSKTCIFRKYAAAVLALILTVGLIYAPGREAQAANPGEHQIFLASDYQGTPKKSNLESIARSIRDAGISPELAVWCGDYIEETG